jgi:hypothetical protein
MENEIMNYEDETMETENFYEEVEAEETGLSTGAKIGIAVATAIAGAGIAAFAWFKNKKKKELRQPEEDQVIEVTEEDIESVTE